jgi:hypothetical protein
MPLSATLPLNLIYYNQCYQHHIGAVQTSEEEETLTALFKGYTAVIVLEKN